MCFFKSVSMVVISKFCVFISSGSLMRTGSSTRDNIGAVILAGVVVVLMGLVEQSTLVKSGADDKLANACSLSGTSAFTCFSDFGAWDEFGVAGKLNGFCESCCMVTSDINTGGGTLSFCGIGAICEWAGFCFGGCSNDGNVIC